MAKIIPFCAVRPRTDLAGRIAALPYDVYSREEAYEAVKDDSLSFLRIDRPETQFPADYDMYAQEVYEKARDMLNDMIHDGAFVQEEKRAYYVYELVMNGRSQVGIAACASVDDYENQVIKKHENTRADKEAVRIRHVDVCSAQTGPIFLAYRANAVINEVVAKTKKQDALYDFVADDEIRHAVWKISSIDDNRAIREAFNTINSIYIADGHHRAASAVKVGLKRREEHPDYTGDEEFNYFLSVLFPDDQLMIMSYNRVVKDLNGLDKEEFFNQVSKYFCIEEKGTKAFYPEQKGCFGMYLDEEWYLLSAKETIMSDDPVDGLDVAILQDYLLTPILGIGDPRIDNRIAFIGGIRGLEELEKRADGDMKIAFSMYPTSIGELFDVADAELLMPPKSTWFEPKLRSGLFIHKIEE